MNFLRSVGMLFIITIFIKYTSGEKITISNTDPKLDIHGNIVNGHDGTIRRFGSYWWYHAAEYGLCKEPPRRGCDRTSDNCGFHDNHNVSIWRSPDLSSGSWEYIDIAVQCRLIPGCSILYRPHLVFNPTTKLYVLFVNFVSDTKNGRYAVYTSMWPEGPFELRNKQMNVTRSCPGPVAQSPCGSVQGHAGDFDVFVDDDGTGYLIYSAKHYISIEKLTPDFFYSTGQNATWQDGSFNRSIAPDYFVEAPVLFKRKKLYYALYGYCCCFCYQGSGILVFTAHTPMGPWVAQPGGDRACITPKKSEIIGLNGEPTPGQGCLYGGKNQVSTTRSQQNFVITVPIASGEMLYIWTGDRWQQAPDGIKGHEGQFWSPLNFDINGILLDVSWINNFTIDIDIDATLGTSV